MGGVRSTPREFIDAFAENHITVAKPAIGSPEVEFLGFRSESRGPRIATWSKSALALLDRQRIAVCRQSDHGIPRYFSARIRGSTILDEAPLDRSIARLIYSSAAVSGTPVRVSVRKVGVDLELTVPERLPTPEYRLGLLSATDIRRFGRATAFQIEASIATTFLEKIRELGCELEPTL
jgi:hypothetical protein